MSTPQPSVGRVVHYVSHGTPVRDDGTQAHPPKCRAAVITDVPEYLTAEPYDGCPNGTDGQWLVGLAVFNPTGQFFNEAEYDDADEPQGGTWHWPERV